MGGFNKLPESSIKETRGPDPDGVIDVILEASSR